MIRLQTRENPQEPPTASRFIVPLRNRSSLFLLILALTLLSGCATPTQRYSADFNTRQIRSVVILPIDAEVSELSAGGTIEKRDDWTARVVEHLNTVISERYRYAPGNGLPADTSAAPSPAKDELAPLFRAITMNQVLHTWHPGFPKVAATRGSLAYKTGSITGMLGPQKADAALLVYLRDDYATAGRKSLTVLGVIAGIPVRSGFTMASAALVSADGDLLWMNIHAAKTGDLRTREGAETLVAKLMAGAPEVRAPAARP